MRLRASPALPVPAPPWYTRPMPVTDDASASLCVLASGSAGNCSVLEYRSGGIRRACLIDLGISPRRAIKLLAGLGLGLHQIDDVLVTHLDADHFHTGWHRWLPGHVRVRMHASHARRLDCIDLFADRLAVFESGFTSQAGIDIHPLTLAHDSEGVSVYRMDLPDAHGGGRLGFATDLGRVTRGMVDLFQGLDVLAIESNYCPEMQLSSMRPEFLKRRIMGGRGHLSNQEALAAIGKMHPREHVVLLHLSRECNHPDRVSGLHAGADYSVTIAEQDRPTRWVRIGATSRSGRVRVMAPRQLSLFEPMAS